MKRILIGLPLMLLLLTACLRTDEYSPAANATGEDVFNNACIGCHQPKEGGHYFELDSGMANVAAISARVSKGGFIMPAFPNIKDELMHSLSEYVLTLNKAE